VPAFNVGITSTIVRRSTAAGAHGIGEFNDALELIMGSVT
jgi:hypothetical protein